MFSELDSIPPKYRPLYDCLVKKRDEGHTSWQASFKDVEDVICDSLPPSARVPAHILVQPSSVGTCINGLVPCRLEDF